MKKVVTSLVASIVLVTVLNASDYGSVDGDSITKQDIAMILQDPRIDFDKLPETAKKQVIEQIVNRKLIAKNALKNGIEKDPQYVEAMSGIKEDLALQVWQKNEIDKIKFSDTEKRAFYDTNKSKFNIPETFEAFHILVNSEAEANAVIKDLEKAAVNSRETKFKELANSKSKDATAKNGGYLGKFAAEQMVPEFAMAVKALPKGGYSKSPTKTQFGYHVIFVKEIFPAKQLTFDEVKDNINQAMIAEKFNKKIDELTKELRKDAKIVIK